VPQAAPREAVVAQALPPPDQSDKQQQQAAPPPPPRQQAPRQAPPPEQPLPEAVRMVAVGPAHIYVQAGAFSNGANAEHLKARLTGLGPVTVTGVRVNGIDVFRVRVGPVGTVAEADQLLTRTQSAGIPEARIVVD
jgi:rare lipoprotein A